MKKTSINSYCCHGKIADSMIAALAVVAFLAVTVALHKDASAEPDNQKITLSGQIVDERGKLIPAGEIQVNNGVAGKIKNGLYQFSVQISDILQLHIQAENHYAITHTFSIYELQQSQGNIGTITLVSQKPGRTMFAFGGDVMTGRRYYKPLAGDQPLLTQKNEATATRELLKHVKPYLTVADVASANLEIVIAEQKPAVETPKSITFYARPPLVEALKWAGVDHVSLGNNHIYDFGAEGVALTQKYLQQHQLPASGGGVNAEQALSAHIVDHQGSKYSLLGYVGWRGNFTPNQVAERDKGGAAWGSEENISQSVKRESDAGNAVIVQYHGSQEYSYQPTEETLSRMRLAVERGADLVVGHHPHVTQGFELYQGKLIAYSLGNFLFDQYFQETHRSALLYVWMDGEQFVRAEIVPLYVKHYQTTPAVGAVREHILRRLSDQSFMSGLTLTDTGGHAAIVQRFSNQSSPAHSKTLDLSGGSWTGALPIDWPQRLLSVSVDDKKAQCQLGRDLLVTGDFESDRGLVNEPGTWRLSAGSELSSENSRSGEYAMSLTDNGEARATAVTRGFHRLVEAAPNATHSLVGYIQSAQAQSLEVCLEYAPKSRSFAKSLNSAAQECFGTIDITAGDWRSFKFDFPPVDKAVIKGYRLRLQTAGVGKAPIWLDDLSWVAWGNSVRCKKIADENRNLNMLSIAARPGSKVQIILTPP